ncbi:MAG: hypothetical protein JWN85_3916 [Gammaproteobacteria bacterium]|nr:hypothetical protein [Gammaproteobacteria bacterium]
MVPLFVQSWFRTSTVIAAAALCWCAMPARGDAPRNDYPTVARVEYVQECMTRNGGVLSDMYKCSCAIDRIAERLTYDEFVEAGTFARYSTLPGEGGGIFRDPDRAKERAKLYRSLEAEAYHTCGLKIASNARP